MYPVAAAGDMAVDGVFWQLLAYCAGVGGSMLIIGSAAGGSNGLGEDYLRLVYEAHLLDCFRRLHCRYRLLLVHPHLPLCYLKDNSFSYVEKF